MSLVSLSTIGLEDRETLGNRYAFNFIQKQAKFFNVLDHRKTKSLHPKEYDTSRSLKLRQWPLPGVRRLVGALAGRGLARRPFAIGCGVRRLAADGQSADKAAHSKETPSTSHMLYCGGSSNANNILDMGGKLWLNACTNPPALPVFAV